MIQIYPHASAILKRPSNDFSKVSDIQKTFLICRRSLSHLEKYLLISLVRAGNRKSEQLEKEVPFSSIPVETGSKGTA